MAPEAEIGSAGVSRRTITPAMLSFYKEIAGRHQVDPAGSRAGVARRFARSAGGRADLSREYVTPEGLEELRLADDPVEPGTVSGRPTRTAFGQRGPQTGFISYKAEDLRDVARAAGVAAVRWKKTRRWARPGVRCGLMFRPDRCREGDASRAHDRRRGQQARRQFHLPLDRQSGRFPGRQSRASRDIGLRSRSGRGSHGGLCSKQARSDAAADCIGVRPSGDAS